MAGPGKDFFEPIQTGACLGSEVGLSCAHKILPFVCMHKLYMDGYISRRGWKLHNIHYIDWAVDDD